MPNWQCRDIYPQKLTKKTDAERGKNADAEETNERKKIVINKIIILDKCIRCSCMCDSAWNIPLLV